MPRHSLRSFTIRSFAAALAFLALALTASAQDRLSDKDIEALMNNVKNDAKSFRSPFNNAVHKSIIRKTSREKDAKALVQNFENQTTALLDGFKKTKKADSLPAVLDTSDQIEKVIAEAQLGPDITAKWGKIRAELNQLAPAFGITRPPATTSANPSPNGPSSSSQSCADAVGPDRAQRLVEQCLQVSPATHPPCNAANPCQLIVDEIKRSCALIGQNAPKFCGDYL